MRWTGVVSSNAFSLHHFCPNPNLLDGSGNTFLTSSFFSFFFARHFIFISSICDFRVNPCFSLLLARNHFSLNCQGTHRYEFNKFTFHRYNRSAVSFICARRTKSLLRKLQLTTRIGSFALLVKNKSRNGHCSSFFLCHNLESIWKYRFGNCRRESY